MFLIDLINRKKIKAAENQRRHLNLFWRDYIGYHRILLSLGVTETNPKDQYGRLKRVDVTPFEQANDSPKAFV